MPILRVTASYFCECSRSSTSGSHRCVRGYARRDENHGRRSPNQRQRPDPIKRMSSHTQENPSSPNAIPARSSSTGHSNGHHHQASKSALVPLPEESWLSNQPITSPGQSTMDRSNSNPSDHPERRHGKKSSQSDQSAWIVYMIHVMVCRVQ